MRTRAKSGILEPPPLTIFQRYEAELKWPGGEEAFQTTDPNRIHT